MHDFEQEAWDFCFSLADRLGEEFGYDTECKGFKDAYRERVQECIDVELEFARLYRVATEDDPDERAIHRFRRVISVYHEQVHLRCQGKKALLQASQDKCMIMMGRP